MRVSTLSRAAFCGLLLVALLLCSTAGLAAIDNSAAMLVVPDSVRGAAEVPFLFDYTGQKASLARKASCTVSYDQQAVTFDFTIPIKSAYKPSGLNERDGVIWNDDRVEIFLQPNGAGNVHQYIINAAGALYDGRAKDKSWNGSPEYKVTINADNWQVHARIAFSEIIFDPAKGDTIRGNVAVNSNEPGNTFCLTWVHLPVDFSDVGSFGAFKLSDTLPYLKKLDLSDVVYSSSGAHIKANHILAPGDEKVVSRDIPLPLVKNAIVDLNVGDSFAYKADIVNDIVPFIELIAMDANTFTVTVRNADVLSRFVKTLELTVDGKKALNSPLSELAKKIISTKSWKPGDHKFTYRFLTDDGKVFAEVSNTVFTFKPSKINYDISNLDASRYYPSVSYAGGKVGAARSVFDLSKGILPSQVSVNGLPILDKPIQIMFDGKPLPTNGKVKKVSANKNQIQLASTTQVADKTLTIKVDHQYDGFTWYDVSLKSAKTFEYGPLEVVIPLQLDSDVLLSHDALYYDELFGKERITDIGAPTDLRGPGYDNKYLCHGRALKDGESTSVALTSFLSLSTDTDEKYRGIGFSSEGPSGWNVKNYDNTYRITRGEGGKVNLVVTISDGLRRLSTREVKFSFGLEPFPMRAYRNDFHKDYRFDCTFWPGAYEKTVQTPEGVNISFLEKLVRDGVKMELCHESWTTLENYWKPGDNEERMAQYVVEAKKVGIDCVFYFGFLLSNQVPEFPLYHDLVFIKPTTYPEGGFRPYVYYRQGSPDQSSFGVCYNSIWGDRMAEGISEVISRYGLRGVYYDGTLVAGGCANTKHGCGTVDPYGRLVVTFPVRAYRRLGEIVYAAGLKYRPDFIVDHHVGWPYPPAMGLIEGYWTGEASFLFEPAYARTGPESLRAMMNGKLYGVPCDMLKRPEPNLNVCWAQSLLVDAYPRLTAGGGPEFVERMQMVWALYDKYQLTSDTFTPYFESAKKLVKDNPNVYISYYETDKVLVAVVSNYWSEQPQNVTLDLSAFKGLQTQFKDVWRNVDFQLVDGKVSMTIDPLFLRLLVIEKK